MAGAGRWRERGETLGPALLSGVAVLLDLSVDAESFAHAASVGLVALAAAVSGAAAVTSAGRFGPGPLARRFAAWRACGLGAAAACLALEVVERLPASRMAAEASLELTILGALWALLTGWVWGRRSWERIALGVEERPEEAPSGDDVRWGRQEMGEV